MVVSSTSSGGRGRGSNLQTRRKRVGKCYPGQWIGEFEFASVKLKCGSAIDGDGIGENDFVIVGELGESLKNDVIKVKRSISLILPDPSEPKRKVA